MNKFTLKNKGKKVLFYEIPLLVESKLMRYFNIIIFIKSKRQTRLKRFRHKGGNKQLFNLLDRKQMNVTKKTKFCDHVIVNENNLNVLKNKLTSIITRYV